jgi:anti-sigma factor ChrR (cupin superfamily)
MTQTKKEELDGFGSDVWGDADLAEHRDASLGLLQLSAALPLTTPSAALRERLLGDAVPEQRLARYAPAIAEMLDVSLAQAQQLIQRLDDPQAWFDVLPGVALMPAEGGPRAAGALRGFVRVRAGDEFPRHEHLGEEAVLIMQGYYADSLHGEVYGPGDVPRMQADSEHSFRVLADGPDLLGLVRADGGLRAMGQEFLP